MYYDTTQFGNTIKNIRQQLKLTQKEVIELTGISENTIRRLENGIGLPKQETLDLLSVVYRQDISQVFLNFRMKDYGIYKELMNEMDKAFEASNTYWLSKCLGKLSSMAEAEMNDYYKLILKQTIALLKGSILILNSQEYEQARHYLTNGIKLTLNNFNYNNYREYNYNKIELQLLMNLSSVENKLSNFSLSTELAEHCVNIIKTVPDSDFGYLNTKIYLNASYMNHFNGNNKKALQYANEGIAYNKITRSQYASGHLYARKGFAEHNLQLEKNLYMESFKKAYFYHEILDQPDLQALLVTVLKERCNIDLLKAL